MLLFHWICLYLPLGRKFAPLSWMAKQSSSRSGTQQDKSVSALSHRRITVVPTELLWCMMWPIKNPSTMSNSGCMKSIDMPRKMSTNYWLVINPIWRASVSSRQNRAKNLLTRWALSFWRHRPRLRLMLSRLSWLWQAKSRHEWRPSPLPPKGEESHSLFEGSKSNKAKDAAKPCRPHNSSCPNLEFTITIVGRCSWLDWKPLLIPLPWSMNFAPRLLF